MNRIIPYFCLLGVCLTLLTSCQDSQPTIESPDDARRARIGIMTGSTSEFIMKSQFPLAQVNRFDDVMDALTALDAGHVDAAIAAYTDVIKLLRKNPQLRILPQVLQADNTGVGYRKGDDALGAEVNAAIAEMRQDGTLDAMDKRWFSPDIDSYDTVSVPETTSGVPLRIGVTATREPMSFVDKGGRVSGHEGELARRIAWKLHRPLEFSDMKFMSLIPALQSGKIDLIVTGMMATGERKKSINFSDPYYELSLRLLVRRPGGAVATSAAAGSASAPGFLARTRASFYSNIIQEQRYLLLLNGLKATVVISVLATLFGTLLGAVICFMRMSTVRALRVPAKVYISILRGMPVVVLLMLIFYVVFASVDISPVLVAVIAFGMNFGAYVSEMFRTGIEGIDRGQGEAGTAMGFTRVQTFGFIVLPQMLRRILPVYKGEFISLVKMTSIVGYIAVEDLTKASDIIRSRTFDAFFPLIMVAVLYFLIAWLLMYGLDYLERLTDPRHAGGKPGRRV